MGTDPAEVNRLAELDADIAAGLAGDPGTGTDPASRAVLDALAATRADLAALPALPLPPELTARWKAALPPRVDEPGTASSPIRHGEPARGPAPRAAHRSCTAEDPAGLSADVVPADDASTPARVDETGPPGSPIEHGDEVQPVVRRGPVRRPGGRARKRVPGHPFPRTGGVAGAEDRQIGARTARYGRERTERVITPPSERRAGTGPSPAVPSAGRRRRVRPALAVGVALAGLLVVAGVLQARPSQPAVTAAQLGGVARAAVGAHDAGELTDPVRRAGCLRSVAPPGLDLDAVLLGGRGVEFEGQQGILLLFGTGELGRLRVVVVDQACGPGGGTLLADTLIGR